MFSLYFCLYWHRSSRSQIFFKIGVLKNFAYFTGKHLCWSEACNCIKKRLQHGCFPVKSAKFLRSSFKQNTSSGCFCLNFLIYTYVLILIYTYLSILKFSLYYYMNHIKLIKYGHVETATKVFRLKSISSIENNYLEQAKGGVL